MMYAWLGVCYIYLYPLLLLLKAMREAKAITGFIDFYLLTYLLTYLPQVDLDVSRKWPAWIEQLFLH